MIGKTWDSQSFRLKWDISTCQGEYGSDTRCCLQLGRHILRCQNTAIWGGTPNGWGNVSLEIQGQKYCNNFFGSTALRDVLISGKSIK